MENFNPHEVQWTSQKIENFWNYYSLNKSLNDLYFSKQVGRKIIKIVKPYLKQNGNNLDYGCGPGYLLSYLFDLGISCSGLDSSQDSIRAVKEKFAGNKYFKGAILSSGIPNREITDGIYDFVFFIESMEHLMSDKLKETLTELYRIIRAGGYIFVTVPNNEKLEKYKVICPDCGCIFHRVQHIGSFTQKSLPELMGDCGFRTVFCRATLLQNTGSVIGKMKHVFNYWETKISGRKLYVPHLIYLGKK